MTEDYSEEEMYLREHESLDKRMLEAELDWLANLLNFNKSEEDKE